MITPFDPSKHHGETLAAHFDPVSRLVFVGGVPLSRAMVDHGLESCWFNDLECFGRIHEKVDDMYAAVGLHKETGALVKARSDFDCPCGWRMPCQCTPEEHAEDEADRKAFHALPLILLVE